MNKNGMDWNGRIHVDPERNRRSLVPVVVVLIALIVACGLGVYFGLFVARVLAGGA